jgi:hypothetical protein
MNKRLEELFGFNDDNDQDNSLTQPIITQEDESSSPISQQTLDTISKVENALPQVKGLDASDSEMDDLAGLAKEAFNNLMDLGMQVDSRFSAEIFNSASSMLGHAITAKTSKINKKLRMIDLQLKKAELDRKLSVQSQKNESTDATIGLGTGTIVDRDELIKMILNNATENPVNKDK